MKTTSTKIALTLATLTLITACNQKPKTDTTIGDNKNTAVSSVTATSTTTTTVTETANSTTAVAAPTSSVAPVAPAVIEPATSSTATTTTSTTATTKTPTQISPEKAGLAKDLIAFNNAINATAVKSQKLQEAFIKKHKDDKSPDVQVQFIKEGIKSLDQQKADLQAVKLTDPKAIAVRDKFVSTIEQQKAVYTIMINNPKPDKAMQEDVSKKMAGVQQSGEEAQQMFLKLAQESGLQQTPLAGKK